MPIFINWNPSPDFLHVGNFSIKWYGLMWALSIFAGYFTGIYVCRKMKRDDQYMVLLVQYLFIGGLVGARLGQVIFYNPSYFFEHPIEILYVWHGGLSSHGGGLGVLAALYLFSKQYHEYSLLWLLDGASITAYPILGLIRIGNLVNSELVGKQTDVPWAFIFGSVDQTPRHPVVLYEAGMMFLLFGIVLYLLNKFIDTKPGFYLIFFLLVPVSGRLILEFLKEPEGPVFGIFSNTQLLNFPFIICGLVLLRLHSKNKLSY